MGKKQKHRQRRMDNFLRILAFVTALVELLRQLI